MILVLLADGFEEIEALTPVDMLRRAELDVITVGISGKIATGSHGIPVTCDAMPEEVDLSNVEMVIFPGGMPGATNLDASPFTDKAIAAVLKNSGHLAAICAAPLVLGRRDLLKDKRVTCYPGFEDELKGAEVCALPLITDGNITTARGMGVALEFAKELVALAVGRRKSREIARSIMENEPQSAVYNVPCSKSKPAADEQKINELKFSFEDIGNEWIEGEDEKDDELDREFSDFLHNFMLSHIADTEDEDKDRDSDCDALNIDFDAQRSDFSEYKFPSTGLLSAGDNAEDEDVQEEIQNYADKIIEILASFNVMASIRGVDRGPRITRFELVPAKGVKVSSIINLQDDIALNLGVSGMRMEAPIPGKSAVGIEIPNAKPQTVMLKELIESDEFKSADSTTAVCIGKDILGVPIVGDIAKMPHLLLAGAVGTGKTVCINSFITSILYKARPDDVKFILIDPKRVEFSDFEGIPHLMLPIITDTKHAVGALGFAIEEMERRYELLRSASVRNIDAYNEMVKNDPTVGKKLPKIIIVIDEFADLMQQAKDPVESYVMRLAQKSRASGIHLIVSTQSPRTSVITGTIKANIPTRISCRVTSNSDSRTVLETAGAEKLLGRGDMLFSNAGAIKPMRVQGAYVSDADIERIAESIKLFGTGYDKCAVEKMNEIANQYASAAVSDEEDANENSGLQGDEQFLEAVEVVVDAGKASTSLIQRKLGIGYGKAAKYIDLMCDMGVVGEANGAKPRDVLITLEEWKEKLNRIK